MNCTSCGRYLAADARFCDRCGSPARPLPPPASYRATNTPRPSGQAADVDRQMRRLASYIGDEVGDRHAEYWDRQFRSITEPIPFSEMPKSWIVAGILCLVAVVALLVYFWCIAQAPR